MERPDEELPRGGLLRALPRERPDRAGGAHPPRARAGRANRGEKAQGRRRRVSETPRRLSQGTAASRVSCSRPSRSSVTRSLAVAGGTTARTLTFVSPALDGRSKFARFPVAANSPLASDPRHAPRPPPSPTRPP